MILKVRLYEPVAPRAIRTLMAGGHSDAKLLR
jgi:hypothetical protein